MNDELPDYIKEALELLENMGPLIPEGKEFISPYMRKKKGGKRKSVYVQGYFRDIRKEGDQEDE